MKSEHVKQPNLAGARQQILLVDDHPVVCEGLAQRINAEPDLEVCGCAHNGHSALDAIEKLRPHIAVVDIALGAGSGVELIKDIKVRYPHLPALVLSMHDEQLYAERSLHAGAKGYVMKQEETSILLRAIRQVLRGEIYLSEKVKDGIVRRLGGVVPDGQVISLIKQLSDRELEVFQLIGDGFATHEIADRLHISMKTIASHRENIKRKLNLSDGEQLARFAIHWLRYRDGAPNVAIPAVAESSQEKKPVARVKPTARRKTVSAAQ
jgi:DNA-binding NarL/FixJ family response regulator